MPDIFISYSRNDSERALQLTEQLRTDGFDVWVDRQGIVGSELWATEIAEAIRACPTFLLLISPDSLSSDNVLKELSLASQKRKRIIPVEVVPCELPSSFEYALSGLQRVAVSDFGEIVRAHKHGVSRTTIIDPRKSLIVLPFEDLSPGRDNDWFADGLSGELVDSLGHIKSLRLIDRKTSMDLKGFRGTTKEIAEALRVRYFIQGSVRKFGEQIKISIQLLDFETGEYLWQDSHRGEFKDIFDIQEAVANKVVDGLKLNLTKDEHVKLLDHGTQNAQAFEIFIRAHEQFGRQSREDFVVAIQLLRKAVRLDPNYALAYYAWGYVLAMMYRNYDRDEKKLDEGEALVLEALRLKPDLWKAYSALSLICQLRGQSEEAQHFAEEFVAKDPDDHLSHFALGLFHSAGGGPLGAARAIAHYEQAAHLKPENLVNLWNLLNACYHASDHERLLRWVNHAIPIYEQHLNLHPDHEMARVERAFVFFYAGRTEESRESVKALGTLRDGMALFTVAYLCDRLGDQELALKILRGSIEAGYRNVGNLTSLLEENLAHLKGSPEYEEVRLRMETMELDQLKK